MKRAALFLLVAFVADAGGRFDRVNTRCEQGRSSRGLACGGTVALCDALEAGDKSGNWWCMKGDGTMATGSAVTLTSTGTPTNTTENGWPVRTYTAAQNDQDSAAAAAFPASDFSVCKQVRVSAYANCQLGSFANSGAVVDAATLPLELQVGGTVWMYVSDGTFYSNFSEPTALGIGQWRTACATYQRVGGATNNVGTLYLDGVQVATSSLQRLAQGVVSKWTTNGYVGGGTGCAHATRGQFVTYKLLSAADIARIYARTAP